MVGGGWWSALETVWSTPTRKIFCPPQPDLIGERNLRWLKILWCGYPCTVLVQYVLLLATTVLYYCTSTGMVWYGMVWYITGNT